MLDLPSVNTTSGFFIKTISTRPFLRSQYSLSNLCNDDFFQVVFSTYAGGASLQLDGDVVKTAEDPNQLALPDDSLTFLGGDFFFYKRAFDQKSTMAE